MRPKIYIEEGYLETFELKLKEALSNNSIKQDQYEELLNRLKLQIVITKSKAEVKYKGNKNKIKKIYQKDINELTTYEEFIIKYLIRSNNGFSFVEQGNDMDDLPALYLLNESIEDYTKVEQEKNIYIQDSHSSFERYVLPNSIVSLYVDENMNGIEKIAHRAQNLVIVDPYLFVDNYSDKFTKKVPNIAKILKNFGLDNKNIKSHFSAIVQYESETNLLRRQIEALKNEINNPNLKISVFAIPKKSNFGPFLGSNRYFLTDYCFGEYQHIFDRVGSISANFFHENIHFDFKTLDYCKGEIIKRFKKEPVKIGIIEQKMGDILENPLFSED